MSHGRPRPISHLVALAVTALGLGLVTPGNPAVSTAATAGPATCPEAHSDARVRPGPGNGADLNSVTAAQAAAMDDALDARIRKLSARGNAWGYGGGDDDDHDHDRSITIRTFVHVITRSDGTGGVKRTQVRDQIEVMNDAFAGRTSHRAARTPFRFVLRGLDYTKNDDWYDWSFPDLKGADTDDLEAKTALRRGGWWALNIYVAPISGGPILGYATYPQEGDLTRDGVVLIGDSLPGGAAAPFNEGDTGTHEVGHWLGLFHTFENGCKFPGDHVRDTPYQFDGDNIFLCEESADTCRQPGTDPVHNFMSYGDDSCLDSFTRGQSRRMTKTWVAYRAFD